MNDLIKELKQKMIEFRMLDILTNWKSELKQSSDRGRVIIDLTEL